MSEHKPLSPGERAVWAAEFVRALASFDERPSVEAKRWAAEQAGRAVFALRDVSVAKRPLDDDGYRGMLEDMLGHPGALVCSDGRTALFSCDPIDITYEKCGNCGIGAAYHRSRR